MKKYGKRFLGIAKGTTSAMSTALQAYKMAKEIRTIVNVERKFIDVTLSAYQPTQSGVVQLLSYIPQGDTDNQRNGNKVKLQSISMKINSQIHGSNTPAFIRLILFNDKVSNGLAPTVTEVLQSAALDSHYNTDNCPSRFVIYKDKTLKLDSSIQQIQYSSIYKKLYHHLNFTGTGNGQSDCNTGHIYVLLLTNVPSNEPYIAYNSRITYVDN